MDVKLLKGVFSDQRYKIQAGEQQKLIDRTRKLLSRADKEAEIWLELAKELFEGVVNLGDVFGSANDEEKRKLMMLVGSKWSLGDKKVALIPKKSLDLLHSANCLTDWRARPDGALRAFPLRRARLLRTCARPRSTEPFAAQIGSPPFRPV